MKTPYERNIMNAKKTYENAKARLLQAFEERPLETIGVLSAAALAVAKIISSTTEARNAKTWRKEVQRREQKQRARY